jgi:rubredoxin
MMIEERRECPLCGEYMHLVERTVVSTIPGNPEERTSHYYEWVCPECDYFEEKEDGATSG